MVLLIMFFNQTMLDKAQALAWEISKAMLKPQWLRRGKKVKKRKDLYLTMLPHCISSNQWEILARENSSKSLALARSVCNSLSPWCVVVSTSMSCSSSSNQPLTILVFKSMKNIQYINSDYNENNSQLTILAM